MTERWLTIEELRKIPNLVYVNYSVIEPTGGVDGALKSADGTILFPLDVFTPSELPHDKLSEHGIHTTSEEMSPNIVRELVTTWCREHLGHTNVTFDL